MARKIADRLWADGMRIRDKHLTCSGCNARLALLFIGVLLTSCGGGGMAIPNAAIAGADTQVQPGGVQEAADNPADSAGLASPKGLLAVEGTAYGERALGSQYEAAWPHRRASISGTAAKFSPNGELDGIDGLAYAIYRLDLAAIAPNGQLAFEWAATPSEGNLWLAVPDFKHDRWRWYSVEDSAGMKLLGWNLYVTDFSELYVVVAVSGGEEAVLARVGMGSITEVVEGGWRYERGDAQRSNRSEFTGPIAFTETWIAEGFSSPFVGPQGEIYAEKQDELYALNSGGNIRMKFPAFGRLKAVASDGTLYFGGPLAVAPNGVEKWSISIEGYWLAMGPDDACYITGKDSLYCINADGTLRWVAEQQQVSSTAVFLSDGTLVVQEGKTVLKGFDTRGQQVFFMERPDAYTTYLVAGLDDILYWMDRECNLVAWRIGEGILWQLNCRPYMSNLSIGPDGTAYLLCDGVLHAYSPEGALLWIASEPVLPCGNNKYYGLALDAEGKVYAYDESSVRIDVFTAKGEFITRYQLENSNHIYAPKIIAPGIMLVSSDGALKCLRQVPELIYSPVDLQATDGQLAGAIRCDWECPGAQPDYCLVYRSLKPNDNYALIGETNGAETSYTDLPPNPLNVYFYKATAFKGDEESEPSWEDSGFTGAGALPSAWSMSGANREHTRRSSAHGPASADVALHDEFLEADTILTSPAVRRDGVAYYGTGNGLLIAATRFGEKLWEFKANGPIYSSPAIRGDGMVIFGDDTGTVYALNPGGELLWSTSISTKSLTSPVLGAGGEIYLGSRDGSLYALSPEGNISWQFASGDPVESTPAIGADGTLYSGCNGGNIYAVAADGSEAWRYATGGSVVSSPALGTDGAVYCGSTDGQVYALNADGTLRWEYASGGAVIASPAIAVNGTVCCANTSGALFTLNTDGSLRWAYAAGGAIVSSPAIDIGDNVYAGCDDGSVYALKPSGELAWQLDCHSAVQASPALGDDGTLYFANTSGWVWSVPPI